jgi:hypothetical protein
MDIYSTSTFEVCNAVFQPYETQLFGAAIGVNGKMADYVHTQNPNAKFLTNRPFVNKTTSVCGDEYGNLWFCLPLAEDPLYSIVYTYYNKANAIIGSNTIGNIPSDEHRFVIVPYGPQNLLLATGTAYYTISIMHDGQYVSEMLRFNLENCGCEKEQVFFVCDHLGYDTMRFTAVETRSVSVSQTEICLDVPCGASATEGVKSGLSQTNTDAHEKFTLISDKLMMNEANLEWFISFKKSESRYILRKMSDGTKAPFRLLIESGETQIYRHDDTIQLVIECRYGFDLVTQNEG